LIREAEERELPLCPLLEALSLTVTEARKCSAVVHKLLTNKVSTRSVNYTSQYCDAVVSQHKTIQAYLKISLNKLQQY